MSISFFSWRRLVAALVLGLVALFGLDKLMTYWLAYHSESGPVARAIEAEVAASSEYAGQPFVDPDTTRQRGVSWVGGDSITAAELEPLRKDHVTWLAQTPFGWQASATEPAIRTNFGPRSAGRRLPRAYPPASRGRLLRCEQWCSG